MHRQAEGQNVLSIVLIGPTSMPWDDLAAEVEQDLDRLARSGIELHYRTTGLGPPAVRTHADAVAAAPHVVRTAVELACSGANGLVVDCIDDPGVAHARALLDVPIVGPGAAVEAALARADRPVRVFTPDELRRWTQNDIVRAASEAATVVLGATGFSHLGLALAQVSPDTTVIDPLPVALDTLLEQLAY